MKPTLFLGSLCLLLLSFFSPQTKTLKGTVLDVRKQPIAGASILIQGTQKGTVTDASGHFNITIESGNTILIVAAIGYDTKQIKVKDKDEITVILKASSQSLQEVVVTGYGVQRKAALTAASSSLFYSPAPSAGYISGRAAGVFVSNESKRKADAQYDKNIASADSDYNREGYDVIEENPFLKTTDNPLSTFSIDVDAASYSNIRRFLHDGQLPPAGAVRIEEMINYFTYQYPQPKDGEPFSINTELATCPWNTNHKLAMIGLQGKIIPAENLPASNLVFLIDVSGSMMDENKLPLVQSSLKLLTDQLRPQDKVSLVVYAGSAGLVLPATRGDRKATIKEAIEALEAGGSTAGGQGIQLAYKTAKENFIRDGNNRVILCTDGDFNVGISSDDELERMIEKERESGVFLSVLGYGTGNYQDAKMQKLADKGNGNHAYIDGISEANKVLVQQFGGTLFTIAKDVKLQVEFNPAKVQGYRLIGYENRLLAKEDFNDDKKDAGELGSGHTVTALYEIIPVGEKANELKHTDSLRYTILDKEMLTSAFSNEVMNIKLRYKQPDGNKSVLLQQPVVENENNKISDNFRLASSVAQFGLLLRHSSFKANASYEEAETLAKQTLGYDKEGYRKELLELMKKAARLSDEEVTRKEE